MNIGIRDTVDRAAALARLATVERWAIDGATVPDMIDGAYVLDVLEDGLAVGAIALTINGDVATVTAAASTGRGTGAEIELLHDALRAQGLRQVRLFTRRPGAIRKTTAHGYRVQACELVKDL